jgi:hypothetical protein
VNILNKQVPFIKASTTEEAIKKCNFRKMHGLARSVSDENFPWITFTAQSFEARLIEFDIKPYFFELHSGNEKFTLPNGFIHANHTHLLSYHVNLPENDLSYRKIAAAGTTGIFSAGNGVLYLADDGEGGLKYVRDEGTSMGNEMIKFPHQRTINVHSIRGYFEDFCFLIVKPLEAG